MPTTISLLDLDPELAGRLPPLELARVRNRTVLESIALEPGAWSPEDAAANRVFAILVLDGILVRELVLAGTPTAELLGPGDLAATASSSDDFLPTSFRWTVVSPASVAVVGDRLAAALNFWPSLMTELLRRAAQQNARLALQRAIAQLPRVEDRLLALFWHLAERWGRVGTTGVIIPLALTHTMLGRLVGARRPTVSLALKELEQRGCLARREDGSWVVGLNSLSLLQTEDVDAPAPPGISVVESAEPAPAAPEAVRIANPLERLRAGDIHALFDHIGALREQHRARLNAVTASVERARQTVQEARALRRLGTERRAGSGAVRPPPSQPAP